jgi:hypothetical protein
VNKQEGIDQIIIWGKLMFNPINRYYPQKKPLSFKITISGIGYIVAGTINLIINGLIGFAGIIILIISGEGMENTIAVADWFALFLGLVMVVCIVSFFCFIIGFLGITSGFYIFARKRYSLVIISGIMNLLILFIWVYVFSQDMVQSLSFTSLIFGVGFITIFLWQLISIIFIMKSKNEFDIIGYQIPKLNYFYR